MFYYRWPLDLYKEIDQWLRKNLALQSKKSFKPDPDHVKMVFNLLQVSFNNYVVPCRYAHKHLGLRLNYGIIFGQHLKEKNSKANKGIILMRRLRRYIQRDSFLCLYREYIRLWWYYIRTARKRSLFSEPWIRQAKYRTGHKSLLSWYFPRKVI